MLSEGSVWRKWDLHVHTPASYEWKGPRLADMNVERADAYWSQAVKRMNELDIAAFCFMDYWTFDGYLSLRSYVREHPGALMKTVFPGIELRLQAPTDFRLNFHVLFDDQIDDDRLALFLSRLQLVGQSGRSPARQFIIEAARALADGKLREKGYSAADRSDDDRMYALGVRTIEVTQESLDAALQAVGRERCLLVLPYDTYNGVEKLDWKKHPQSDAALMRMADCFETRRFSDLFLGVDGTPIQQEFLDNMGGRPKPAFSGSDAHSLNDYGKYPKDRATWIKAAATFAGLRQVCQEPRRRCYVGALPPAALETVARSPGSYIESVSIRKVGVVGAPWFDGATLPLNPGLVAVVGNKGSGKSALADIIALCGNAKCSEMEFLASGRFRAGGLARSFEATLKWRNGIETSVNLDSDWRAEEPVRVRYLSQRSVEKLCNELVDGEQGVEAELKSVIFSHIPVDEREGCHALDELLAKRRQIRDTAIARLRLSIHGINERIASVEKDSAADVIESWRKQLAVRLQDLAAWEERKPAAVESPRDVEPQLISAVRATDEALGLAESRLAGAVSSAQQVRTAKQGVIRVWERVSELRRHVENVTAEIAQEAQSSGVSLGVGQLVVLQVEESMLRQVEMALQEQGLRAQAQATQAREEIARLTKTREEQLLALEGPAQSYGTYLEEMARWEAAYGAILGDSDQVGTVAYLKRRIDWAEAEAPALFEELCRERRALAVELAEEFVKVLSLYRDAYAPVQAIADREMHKDVRVSFVAAIEATGFGEAVLGHVHRNRKGALAGDGGVAVMSELLGKANLASPGELVALGERVLGLLVGDAGLAERHGRLVAQLRPTKDPVELYDLLFGLSFVCVRYSLEQSGRSVSQLSPGEKGALLLAFYLLLDDERIPIVIDQPEQNLDNESVVKWLIDYLDRARTRRQVVLVTHNPNLAVVCDADQIVHASIDRGDGVRVRYASGAIEDREMNRACVDVLEGTYAAFDNRSGKYRAGRGGVGV